MRANLCIWMWMGLALLKGCSFGPLDLQNRPCPCVEGWRCEVADAGDRCIPDVDAGPSARIPAVFAFGNDSELVSLDEGVTWCATRMSSPSTDGAAWDGIRFVMVYGSDATSVASTNGYEWAAPVDIPNGQWAGDVAYGNGIFLMGGGCAATARSQRGESWEVLGSVSSGCDAMESIAFGDGRFVAGLRSGQWWASTDGDTWAFERDGGTSQVVFADGVFRAPGDPRLFRGRGVCLAQRSGRFITRSVESDCLFPSDVTGDVGRIQEILFVDVPASDFTAGRLPTELADCLGIR